MGIALSVYVYYTYINYCGRNYDLCYMMSDSSFLSKSKQVSKICVIICNQSINQSNQ